MRRRRHSRQLHSQVLVGGQLMGSVYSEPNERWALPPALGGRGNLVGLYDQTLAVVLTVYGNWTL